MRLLAFVLAAAALIAAAETAGAAPRSLVPDGWREVPASREGAARAFVSPNGAARLLVGHIAAHPKQRQREMDQLMYRDGETITYHRQGGSWLAVSGYRNGDIFYRKSNLACRGTRWHTVDLQYPRAAKEPLDPLVAEIARRMGDYGSVCG